MLSLTFYMKYENEWNSFHLYFNDVSFRTKVPVRQPLVSQFVEKFFAFCMLHCFIREVLVSNKREGCVGKFSIWAD
jgi:hypothetical protein